MLKEWEKTTCQGKQCLLHLSHRCIYIKSCIQPSPFFCVCIFKLWICFVLERCLKYTGEKVVVSSQRTEKTEMFLLWIFVYIHFLLLNFLHLHFAFKEFSANVTHLLSGFCLFVFYLKHLCCWCHWLKKQEDVVIMHMTGGEFS